METKSQRYERYKAAGLCPNCIKPNTSLFTYCDDCRARAREVHRKAKPRPERIQCQICEKSVDVKPIGGVPKFCADCGYERNLEKMRGWSRDINNRVRRRKYDREYRRNWRDTNRKRQLDNDLRRKYGITLETFQSMFDSQEGKCAICSQKLPTIFDSAKDRKLLAVDHNHTNNEVRGLLCAKCNWALGLFRDSVDVLKSAISYLEVR